jgi:hypothetical protein
MRTWNSTAGWRKNSRAAVLAAGGLVLLLAASAAGKEKAVDAPEMEMLEFLGTYETAGGKEVDPMLQNEAPKPEKARQNERQPARKPAKPDKKKKTERNDE